MRIALFICLIVYIGSCQRNENRFSNLEDLANARIAVVTGSAPDLIATETFPEAVFFRIENIMDGVLLLRNNKVDAVVLDEIMAKNLIKTYPEFDYLKQPLSVLESAIAVNKANPELLSEVDLLLSGFKREGVLQEMYNRWFGTDNYFLELSTLRLSDATEVLRVGTYANRPPVCFIDENQNVYGYEYELALRLAYAMNKSLEMIDISFSGLLPSLISQRIDLIISDFKVTEERKQAVNFSIPYLNNNLVFLVNSN